LVYEELNRQTEITGKRNRIKVCSVNSVNVFAHRPSILPCSCTM